MNFIILILIGMASFAYTNVSACKFEKFFLNNIS